MLQIRLLRVGKKHHPYFRLVLVNKGKRPGKYLENLGFYSPTDKKGRIKNLEAEKIKYWIAKGAQATPTVHNILVDEKVIDKTKIKIKISKSKKSAQGGSLPTGQAGAAGGKEAEKPGAELKTAVPAEAAKPAETSAKPAEKAAAAPAEAAKSSETAVKSAEK